jgi:hypothetical protein
VVLSVGALVALAAAVVGVLVASLGPPDGAAPGAMREGGAKDEGPAIAGTISVLPELLGRLGEMDTLFVIARKSAGPPFAVKRIGSPRFPLTYRLGPADVMMAGTPFDGKVSVSARLTSGGAGPAQPGDLEGEHPGRVAIGASGVDIVITRTR